MTVDRNESVMEMIEETLRENPEVANEELQERASEIDPRIEELSPRSFNARYPLQVKRKLAVEEEEKTAARVGEDELRSVVRQTLLDFAKDYTGAGNRGEAIDVVRNVDEYVDRVIQAELTS